MCQRVVWHLPCNGIYLFLAVCVPLVVVGTFCNWNLSNKSLIYTRLLALSLQSPKLERISWHWMPLLNCALQPLSSVLLHFHTARLPCIAVALVIDSWRVPEVGQETSPSS